MHLQHNACSVVFMLMCSIGIALSLKRREHVKNVETLREAVNNAFDALIEVHQAIPKDKDFFEEDSINADYGDIGMDKETAEKFIEEIDQLEDMIMNKEDVNVVPESRRQQKKEDNGGKRVLLTEKRSKNIHIKEVVDSEVADDKDIDRSFDSLVDILKKSIRERKRNTKFQDYLMSTFEKETRGIKKNKEVKTFLIAKKEKQSKKEKGKVVAGTTYIKKSNVSHPRKEVKNCGGSKKECVRSNRNDVNKHSDVAEIKETNEKEEKPRAAAKSATKSTSLKKKKTVMKPHTSKTNTKSGSNASEANKTYVTSSRKHSSSDVNYDREIKDLVDIILKRREETKREKLKLALADVFQILESKHTYIHKNDAADNVKKHYERMIIGKLFE